MSRVALVATFAALACACRAEPVIGLPPEPPAEAVAVTDADPVIFAERAFAARAREVSARRAFLEFVAPDAVMIPPTGVGNARTLIEAWPQKDDAGFIKWWPSMAGLSASGDLGFTTGPATYDEGRAGHTHYFTVWRLQPDGAWRWVIDLGSPATEPSPFPPGATPAVVPAALAVPAADLATARDELTRAEAALVGAAGSSQHRAYLQVLAPEGRIMGFEPLPAEGAETIGWALHRRPEKLFFQPVGGDAARSGDLGYTYGLVSWARDGVPARGAYLRVWQRRAEGWVVLADAISPF